MLDVLVGVSSILWRSTITVCAVYVVVIHTPFNQRHVLTCDIFVLRSDVLF